MSQKRQQREEGTAFFDDKRSRKSHSFRRVVQDVMSIRRLQNLMNPILEPLLRRVIKEEVDSALRKYIVSVKRNCENDIDPSESKCLQLQFVNAISLPVFTGTRIEGEGCSSNEVALVDRLTGQIVSSGPGSSGKVEMVALEGDFGGDDGDNWSLEEFASNIVKEREGKKPLLTGDLTLTLKDGTGLLGDLSFTDNSSWTRSRKFRLGARLMDDIGGIRIREARSEPFVVRDHRGELYKKHHPPHLSDEVWRLEKIAKDGALHKRLSKEGVNTVQDFLILLSLNPTGLQNILGPGMSAKKWEVMVEHARTCVLDKTLYFYSTSMSLQKEGVVFNVVGQVMGMFSNDQCVVTDKLSEGEKVDARDLVISAFGDHEKIVTIDESSLNMHSSSSVSEDQPSSNLLSEGDYNQDFSSHEISTSPYPQLEVSPDFMHSLYSIGGSTSFDHCLSSVDPLEIGYDQHLSFPGQAADASIFEADYMARAAICAREHFEEDRSLRGSALELSADLYSAVNAFMPCPADKAQKGWTILVFVLRWRFSIKRIVARKSARSNSMRPRGCKRVS